MLGSPFHRWKNRGLERLTDLPEGDAASANFSFKLRFWGLQRAGGGLGRGAAGKHRRRESGPAGRGEERNGTGGVAQARAVGTAGLVARDRGGWPGTLSGTAGPGQLPDAAGDWPAPPGPNLPGALRSGSEQATYRAAQRKWLEFLPRRLARAWGGRGGAGRAPEGACAGAAGRRQGAARLPAPAPAGAPPPGAFPELVKGHGLAPPETPRASPASCLLDLSVAQVVWVGPVGSDTAPLLIGHLAPSLWAQQSTQLAQDAWAPAEGGAEALRCETSARPSLPCFFRKPWPDICKCSRPGLRWLAAEASLYYRPWERGRSWLGRRG